MLLNSSETVIIVTALIFATVALVTFAVTNSFSQRERVRRRFATVSAASIVPEEQQQGSLSRGLLGLDLRRLGVGEDTQRRLRREVVRAGYFSPYAVPVFAVARLASVVLFPSVGYLLLTNSVPDLEATPKIAAVGTLFLIGYYLPSAFISRRQRLLQDKYRVTFPDLLDMLVVCINAGLGLDAALNRVARELGPDDAELLANFDLMAGEMRAGKSTMDAFRACAERLGLPEARSLATLLQQSTELGTDIAVALTTFSDEIRDKRMSRAEERAASLPPKLTLPLGAFIFPVILIVVLTPAVLNILKAVGQ